MLHPEEDQAFQCPHCGAEISMTIDATGGLKQSFVYDCEVCCKPINIRLELGSEGVVGFSAEGE